MPIGTLVTAQRKGIIMGLSIDEFLKNRAMFTDTDADDETGFYIGDTELTRAQVGQLIDYCYGLARRVDAMDECCSWDNAECGETPRVLSMADDIRNLVRNFE